MADKSSLTGLGEFFLPPRPLDHQQPAIGVGQWLEPAEKFCQWRNRSHDERVESPRAEGSPGNQFLSCSLVHRQRETDLAEDGCHGPSPLADAFRELHPQIGPEDGQEHAWYAAACSHIENPFAMS